MSRVELRLVDDTMLLVQNTLATVLREYDAMDPRQINLDKVQKELDQAFSWLSTRPCVCIKDDRLHVEFV